MTMLAAAFVVSAALRTAAWTEPKLLAPARVIAAPGSFNVLKLAAPPTASAPDCEIAAPDVTLRLPLIARACRSNAEESRKVTFCRLPGPVDATVTLPVNELPALFSEMDWPPAAAKLELPPMSKAPDCVIASAVTARLPSSVSACSASAVESRTVRFWRLPGPPDAKLTAPENVFPTLFKTMDCPAVAVKLEAPPTLSSPD